VPLRRIVWPASLLRAAPVIVSVVVKDQTEHERARKMKKLIAVVVFVVVSNSLGLAAVPDEKHFTNSIGMKLVRVEPGEFTMGQVRKPLRPEVLPVFRGRGLFDSLRNGDYDEMPVHRVRITRPFYVGVFEVTNFQYELFRPEHKQYRGREGLSTGDNEAATFISWYDAAAFCKWLSDKEGLPYRLPTEAEWEYACRAGRDSTYNTGSTLPKSFLAKGSRKARTDLTVGSTPANAWGIHDMHGGVEEWCSDWYGPYVEGLQVDPVGYADGDFRVTRGGSGGSDVYFLRSANRMGAIPESRNWVTGFRVIIGEPPATERLVPPVRLHQQNVAKDYPPVYMKGPDPEKPYFKGPLRYVNMPRGSDGPVYTCHNHDPAIVECPNGDLLTCWYTCHDEHGRELAQAASRLRPGSAKWEQAALFFYTPDRNNHAPSMWYDDKKQMLYHFTGVSAARSRGRSAIAMRTSGDSGATWSPARLIVPGFERNHLPSEPVFRMYDGTIAFSIDGPNTLWMSRDEGLSWFNPGGDIPGIHTGVTQLSDGSIFAFSRGYAVEGKLPISISTDGGKTFTQKASEFPTVGGGQRLALLKLRSGQLFLASFTNEGGRGIWIEDSTGSKREIRGLFAALSEDDGKTWPYKRLITDDGPSRTIECTDGAAIAMSGSNAEYRGYLAACQSLDGLINVISSRNHYAFNLKWLKTTPPPAANDPLCVQAAVETFDGPADFDLDDWHDYKGPAGGFNGKGSFTLSSGSHYNGFNRRVGTGSFEAVFSVKNIRYNPQGPRIAEGLTIGFRDPMSAGGFTMFIFTKLHEIAPRFGKAIRLDSVPRAIKFRFTYDNSDYRWRVFYGLNGAEPTTEFAESSEGVYWKEPSSESCAAYILMSNGSADLDYFEIKPL